jgi:hypothetical protein
MGYAPPWHKNCLDLRESKMSKHSIRMLLITAFLAGFCTCASADVLWTLDVTFTDGLTGVGTFVTTGGSGAVAPTFVSWDVTFAGGTAEHDFIDSSTGTGTMGVEFPPNIFWPTDTEEELSFAAPGFTPYVDFYLATPLTEAGGSILFEGVGADSCDGTCYTLNPDHPETLVGLVPEPGAVFLLGTIVISVALAMRRQKAARPV